MKAVIETGGKQYRVEEGSVIYVEKLDAEAGKKYVFDKVVMTDEKIGHPYINGATVEAKVEKQGRRAVRHPNRAEFGIIMPKVIHLREVKYAYSKTKSA